MSYIGRELSKYVLSHIVKHRSGYRLPIFLSDKGQGRAVEKKIFSKLDANLKGFLVTLLLFMFLPQFF
jgi:hypothetical protein